MSDIPGVIQAKAFQLVDDNGKVRAELGMNEGHPELKLVDDNGKVRAELGMNEGHPELKLLDSEGESRLRAGVIYDESYLIVGKDFGSRLEAIVSDGHPLVKLLDVTPRSTISEAMREVPNGLILLGTDTEGRLYLSFSSHGGYLRAEVESGKPTLSLTDKELDAKNRRTVFTTDGIKKNQSLYGNV